MKRGAIVLTPFPFTDLSGRKVRPALVVSRSDRPGSDVVLAFISSYRGQPLLATDLFVENTHPDFGRTGLKATSVIKRDKLVTVDTSILLGELGELPFVLLREADTRLRYALDV
ncbi:MAG: type II toxin-antitoxin system PemK/MazF family toxin [Planctomycetes bacterium]|nr:type II toxin-antitoxin system PemK/MazF family toxin [Planctomycetota bacterium]MBM4078339.1 type II toxin-antitoxin system PemK/MazF family toxin [Planctomycetota bacterium]